jgi:hypothetical protein
MSKTKEEIETLEAVIASLGKEFTETSQELVLAENVLNQARAQRDLLARDLQSLEDIIKAKKCGLASLKLSTHVPEGRAGKGRKPSYAGLTCCEGCDEPIYCKGVCRRCYMRNYTKNKFGRRA